MRWFKQTAWLSVAAGAAAGLFVMFSSSSGETQDGGRKATLVCTAAVRGEVAPCG